MKYSEELKDHVVGRVIAGEARICDPAKQYSIPAKRVSLWAGGRRKQNRETANLSKAEPVKRISALEKEAGGLTTDNDILKKAAAPFASPRNKK